MSPRKAVEQELTREMIMDTARKLFLENGYQHVSMRQISKELGYSHGAIYYHFKNKADLFYALVRQDFILLDEALEQILNKPLDPHSKLREVLLGFIKFGLTKQSHYEIMFLIKDEEVRTYVQQEPNLIYEKFAKAVYALCNQQVTLTEIWSVFLSLHGLVSHYCRSGQTFEDVRTLAESHVDFILRSLVRK
ncbi:TetR/AcrR family transcriptional regulator [Effusibacillus lacus]|uniref:TetR family transcriptional regulator n=1 Tax=Effusibacillus lacus TaxID=1348429 RepID=A0A292YKS3_9BACL|nr:TetR/AcrR family transcriptional regulator [Effusibacillus lacus]TCS75134.1 TetR family transcriptional regulator [Effusibacillus lacus]GAX89085.1 TetR family transcriptional regulator [Effusibacillus lacus]